MRIIPSYRTVLRLLLVAAGAAALSACLPEETSVAAADLTPLAVPAGITAVGGDSRVTLSWAATPDAQRYLVKRSVGGAPFTALAMVSARGYVDTSVVNGIAYSYVVAAQGDMPQSADSAPVTAMPRVPSGGTGGPGPALPPLPGVPAGLTTDAGDSHVMLRWSAASNATQYVVERATTPGGPYMMIALLNGTQYDDRRLTNGVTYYYVVNSVNAAGASADSGEASGLPLIPPSTPTQLVATPGNASVSLNWSASALAFTYRVRRSMTSGGPFADIGTTAATSYVDSAVSNGTTYYYTVAAENPKGLSRNAAQASATPDFCAVRPPAGWQDITPTGTDAQAPVNGTIAAALIADPFESRRLWLGTGERNDELWKSEDCGATWLQANTGAGGVGDGSTPGVGDGAQWSMQADFVVRDVLYATSATGAEGLWKSVDGGTSWVDVLAGSEFADVAADVAVNTVSIDAADHRHLLVSAQGLCAAPYAPTCLGETHDGGATWRVLTAPEPWQDGSGVIALNGGHWLWCGAGMWVTTDAGTAWSQVVLPGGGTCDARHVTRALVSAANGRYYLGSPDGVLSSLDGITWTRLAGTSGPMGVLAVGTDRLFAASRSQPVLRFALLADDTLWSDLPLPAQLATGTDGGIAFLAVDDAHGLLHASMASGGAARIAF